MHTHIYENVCKSEIKCKKKYKYTARPGLKNARRLPVQYVPTFTNRKIP